MGAVGKYLNELLAIAGLAREDVFIANVLKCRPPETATLVPRRSSCARPYLREQTRTIDPEYMVTLGNFSTKFILKTDVGITRLHGTLQRAGRFKVFPIFHPAAALYDGSKRVALENDFATLGELLRSGEVSPADLSVFRCFPLERARKTSIRNRSATALCYTERFIYVGWRAGARMSCGVGAFSPGNDKGDRGQCIQSKPLSR